VKKIGIVGGTAWLSTVHYYQQLCERSEALYGITPEFSIESLDLRTAFSLIGTLGEDDSWAAFDAYHRTALSRVASAGAAVALLAANTPHHRFEAITAGVPVTVVNIVDAVTRTVRDCGLDRVLLLGTSVTMASPVIRERFSRAGVNVDVPAGDEREAVTALIGRIQRGDMNGAQAEIVSIARGRPAILGCTELAFAFPEAVRESQFARDGTTFFNSLAIHVSATLGAASL
jgi:aspartate racemase